MKILDLVETGIPAIDNQHRHYHNLMVQFAEDYEKGHIGEDNVNRFLDEIMTYVVEHFDDEEYLMRSAEYPGYDTHYAQHELWRSKWNAYSEQMNNGRSRLALSEEVISVFSSWLHNHLLTADKQFSDYLKAKIDA